MEGGRDAAILDYFSNLFKAADNVGSMEFLDGLAGRVTFDMVEQMDKPFLIEEVEVTLKQMHPTKALGPDGMSHLFYQKYWSVVGKDVADAVLHSLNSFQFPSALNHTYDNLIPKKKKP